MNWRRRFVSLGLVLGIAAAAALLFMPSPPLADSGPRLLHTEPSKFSPVLVFEEYGERCLNFGTMRDNGRHTCYELNDPQKLAFVYTRMMTTALYVRPDPANILVIGLGGGTLPTALARLLPQATIDSVEIDPAVVKVAERYFGYTPGPRQRVFVEDGRAYVERVHREGGHYDMVLLDAFDKEYIPPHLLTREFIAHVRAILAPGGVLAANSFARSKLYDQESVTYEAVFGEFFNLRGAYEGNRVIIATPGPLPGDDVLRRNATALAGALKPLGIDTEPALARFSRLRDWDPQAAILTDQAQKGARP